MTLKTGIRSSKAVFVRKIIFIIFTDLALAAIGIYLYCLFQFILPRELNITPIALPTPTPAGSAADSSVAPGETPGNPEMDAGDFGARFPDKFTNGEIIVTENSYKSKDINVTVEKVERDGVTYYVADIYIRYLENFKTAFANNKYGIGQRESTVDLARKNNAIIAISGDYYGARQNGIVIRNGQLYRSSLFQDILIMYNDGSMKTYRLRSLT